MLEAKITFHQDFNGKEGYTIDIRSNSTENWGLNSFYPLVKREGATIEEEQNFVHFSIINRINELIQLGYKITLI